MPYDEISRLTGQGTQADPTEPFGAAKWLAQQPLFGPLETPKAIYQAPTPGQMNVQPYTPPVPGARAPSGNDEGDGGGLLGNGGPADAHVKPGGLLESLNLDYADMGNAVGNLASALVGTSLTGPMGAGIGTYVDQLKTDPVYEAFGLPAAGFGGWLEGFARSALPMGLGRMIGLLTPEQQMFAKLMEQDYGDTGWSDRTSAEERARDRFNDLSRGFTDAASLEGSFATRDMSDVFGNDDDDDRGGFRDADSARDRDQESRDSGAW